jgi:hypothetical protein
MGTAVTSLYKDYSQGDKDAFKELRRELNEAGKTDFTLKDLVEAVEPSLVTPEVLIGF